ncbi:hypothetical protein [Methanolobus profundi]|uniref:Uncharacterized protein n=1 Tax=Methanolobus profundi TaxID=487685 RepID=A0A1I4P8Y4_9EURY|nr:hypothetical protein [Methanolobus profundi]SFM24085.1 hypothetical protein SAMN04488696_0508 [Methanolobus profundi]
MHPGKTRRDYNDIESTFLYRKEIIFREHAAKLDILQDSIELLFHLTTVLNAGFVDEFKRTGKHPEGPGSIIPVLFERNNHNLIAAYKLACIGLNNPAYLNLRTVFEGITQMYLLHMTDREAYIFHKQQLGTLTEDEERELKNRHHWLRPSRIREVLYTGDKKEQVDDFYILISNAAHPGIKRAIGDFDYREEVTVDVLSISLALAVASLMAIRDIYSSMINEEEVEEIDDLLDRVMQELSGQVMDISPNHPGLKRK